jgi:hypothetical protein
LLRRELTPKQKFVDHSHLKAKSLRHKPSPTHFPLHEQKPRCAGFPGLKRGNSALSRCCHCRLMVLILAPDI